MNEITQEPRQDVAVTTSSPPTLMSFVERALTDPTIHVEKLDALFRLKREYEADEARLQFDLASSQAQEEMVPVVRDADNSQTKSKYARLETIDAAIRPIYTRHGFSLRFKTQTLPDGTIKVICIQAHIGGHREQSDMDAAPDTKGAQGNVNKTPMHGMASTVTYLRRYLTCMAFNVTLRNEDDDGNAGGGTLRRNRRSDEPPPPPPRKLKDILADLGARFAKAPDRAAIEAVIAEHETQSALAYVTAEPGRSKLAECIANGRARFPIAKDAEQPAFAAYVIDAFGEIVSEEIRDPIRFAHAVVDAWRNAPTPALGNNVIEHNAEAIEEARHIGAAALVLLDMKPVAEDRASDQHDPRDEVAHSALDAMRRGETPPYTPTVIEPPIERGGKPFWPKWVQRFKAALEEVPLPFDNLEAWALAQRETLTRAPMAQRLLAIRALDTAFSPHDMPPWLADLVKADPLPSNGDAPPNRFERKAAELTEQMHKPASGVSQEADEHWVEDRISELLLIQTRTTFDRLVNDNAVRNRMGRLRRERPLLFEKADAAFNAAHRRLPPGDAQ